MNAHALNASPLGLAEIRAERQLLEAPVLLEREKVDVVLMDLQMREMDMDAYLSKPYSAEELDRVPQFKVE
jgi:hypothetical protein